MNDQDDTAQPASDDATPEAMTTPPKQGTNGATDPLALEAEVTRLNDQLLRAFADAQNLRKRVDRERLELGASIGDSVLLELLPVLDELDRAVQHLPDPLKDDDWAKGVLHIRANLEGAFKRLDVTRFGVTGDVYDALRHEAIGRANGPTDTIVDGFECGYERSGRILRPARVIVGGAPSDHETPDLAPSET